MEAVAKLRNNMGSPRKMRLVIDLIRGRNIEEALNILNFSSKNAARPVAKLLKSAISNWEQKNPGERLENSGLFIKGAFVDGGRMLKRYRPASFGRPHKIRKRTNHVTIIVDSRNELSSNQEQENVQNQENN